MGGWGGGGEGGFSKGCIYHKNTSIKLITHICPQISPLDWYSGYTMTPNNTSLILAGPQGILQGSEVFSTALRRQSTEKKAANKQYESKYDFMLLCSCYNMGFFWKYKNTSPVVPGGFHS